MEYNVVYFELEDDNIDNISEEFLAEFIKDSEIIICGKYAYSKDLIKCIGDSLRGAVLRFTDGNFTYGYNITSKLVKRN